MSLKIFHIADLHLGRRFRDHPEVMETLSQARYETLESAVQQANDRKSDVFSIAGDLFDRTSVKKSEVQKAVQAINRFSGKVALVLPGNHDFISEGGDLWQWFKQETEEYVLVLDRTEPVDLQPFGLDTMVYPGPCHSKHSSENAIDWVAGVEKDPALSHIGIAHGGIEGVSPDFDQRYYPMTHQALKRAGVDLWLLGHTHITWPEKPGSRDYIFNPGTPEPDGFSCRHEGRAFFLMIDSDKKITAEIIPTGQYRFEQRRETLTLQHELKKLVKSIRPDTYQNVVMQLTVSGRLDPELYENWNNAIPKLREAVLELKLDDSELVRRVTPQQIRKEFPIDSFPEKLLSRFSENEDEQALQMAYEFIREAGDEQQKGGRR